jgi:hypothetical protein
VSGGWPAPQFAKSSPSKLCVGAGAGAFAAAIELGLTVAGMATLASASAAPGFSTSPGAACSGRSLFTTVLFSLRTSNTAPCALSK